MRRAKLGQLVADWRLADTFDLRPASQLKAIVDAADKALAQTATRRRGGTTLPAPLVKKASNAPTSVLSTSSKRDYAIPAPPENYGRSASES
jgi:hypothetical protein